MHLLSVIDLLVSLPLTIHYGAYTCRETSDQQFAADKSVKFFKFFQNEFVCLASRCSFFCVSVGHIVQPSILLMGINQLFGVSVGFINT
jgi:hypothetical protein